MSKVVRKLIKIEHSDLDSLVDIVAQKMSGDQRLKLVNISSYVRSIDHTNAESGKYLESIEVDTMHYAVLRIKERRNIVKV